MRNPLLHDDELPDFGALRPEHVIPALEKLLEAHRQRLEELLAQPRIDFDSLVVPLEDMRHRLSRLWSPVTHLHMVSSDPGWREAYERGLPMVTEFATELGQNERLYAAFEAIERQLRDGGSPARRRLVEHALRDFRLAGVHLEPADKKRFAEVMQALALASTRFQQNVQDATDAWSFHTTDKAEVSGLPAAVLGRAREAARSRELEGWHFSLDQPTYQAVLTHADDEGLRRRVYSAWLTRASDQGESAGRFDNAELIEEILALRHEAATLTGFDNYAQYSLASKMAGGVDDVVGFLEELAERSLAAGRRELEEVAAFAGRELSAWDLAYYSEKLRERLHDISDERLRSYFPAPKVLEGLFALAGRLYGIRLDPRPGVAVWHESVLYFDVLDEHGKRIGGFYADLYARPGKRGGAWIDECVVRHHLETEPVLPVGYLVCNFTPPRGDEPSGLTHGEVVTLFHEFGHMMHHLLTRVDYPSIAGINGVPWDAVELPSQFMENFAWQRDVLRESSAHVDSGEPLPDELFERLQASRNFNAGLQMLRQIELALFDFRIHAEYVPEGGGRVAEVLDQVRERVTLVKPPEWCRFQNSFGHIFAGGYAAGYYSYKWAEVLAADAFGAFVEAGIFDEDTARRFREQILEIGGSRDILQAFVAFRGREPRLETLLEISGISVAA